jgi:hypothetical protein
MGKLNQQQPTALVLNLADYAASPTKVQFRNALWSTESTVNLADSILQALDKCPVSFYMKDRGPPF